MAIRNERPEEEQNSGLIKELATIRFNYHLTTFKEILNDVIEERKHIINDEIAKSQFERRKMEASLNNLV